jgi:hypothetical protein
MRRLVSFFRKTDGLTTIEWVAVCAIVLVGAIAISQAIVTSAGGLGSSVAEQMDEAAGSDGN